MTASKGRLRRYRDLLSLVVKYGRGDLLTQAGLEAELDVRPEDVRKDGEPGPEAFATDLEALGPTFIKLGQMLSTRADLLPVAYVERLARLQDRVEPFPAAEAREVVAEELGVRVSKAFSGFEARPLASASLGQVHRARLRNGREVAVKVQRPGIRKAVLTDLDALETVADLLDRYTELGNGQPLAELLEEFRQSLLHELDYRQEAENLSSLSDALSEFPRILVPEPVPDYTTGRVLTMSYVSGTKVSALNPVVMIEAQEDDLADELFRAYLKQVLVDGMFHADPHPGNVFLTPDRRVALIDLGMVGYLTDRLQGRLLSTVTAISDGDTDRAATAALGLGEPLENFDENRFRHRVSALVSRYGQATVRDMQMGRMLLDISRIAAGCGIRAYPELTMLGKALLNLDEIGRRLNPEFNPTEAIRRHAAQIFRQRAKAQLSPHRIASRLMGLKEFAEDLPAKLERAVDTVARNDLRVKIEDEGLVLDGLQKVANRITVGLVFASLILGASLIMRIETDLVLFGYPVFALVFFLGAAAGGLWLVWDILWKDRFRPDGSDRR